MVVYSLDELKKIVRKMEFNKTEPEILIELVHKAIRAGEGERERLRHVSKKSYELFKILSDKGFFYQIKENKEIVEELKRIPIGAIDGSFQVVGGIGGRWYIMIGIAQVIANSGFTLKPRIIVDGNIGPIDTVDEVGIYRIAEETMMLGEIKALRSIVEELGDRNESYVLIDGPIIDPPTKQEEDYVEERTSAIRLCYNRNLKIVGFVKRVMGKNLLNHLSKEIGKNLTDFTNDLDLLSTVMFNAVRKWDCPIYTRPVEYGEDNVYKNYKNKGLYVYYSYYKPSLRGRIFRVEYASFEPLEESELLERFHQIMYLINQIWTLPGMDEPLPIILAHNKCNVRRGTAETIYYEIMAKALSEGNLHLWLGGSQIY